MENLTIGQEIEFDIYGTQLRGKFVSEDTTKDLIKVEVISDSNGAAEVGQICEVHKSFLKIK